MTSTTFTVVHRTDYRYGSHMADGYTVAHLLPRTTTHQRVISASVEVDPSPDEYEELTDLFGNRVVRIGVHRRHEHLSVIGRCVVEVDDGAAASAAPRSGEPAEPSWDDVVSLLGDARENLAVDVAPFAAPTAATPWVEMLDDLVGDLFIPGRPLSELVRAVSERINQSFVFDPAFSDVTTPVAEVVAARRGVCQDFAHVMLACLRARGLAARYVSGYIETLPPPGRDKLIGADASHAWCSVWSPSAGWMDVDPTNDQMPPQRHVTVAWGRDYSDVAPVRGVVIGPTAAQHLSVAVDVSSSPGGRPPRVG